MKAIALALLAAIAVGLFSIAAAIDRAATHTVIDEGDAIIDPTQWVREA